MLGRPDPAIEVAGRQVLGGRHLLAQRPAVRDADALEPRDQVQRQRRGPPTRRGTARRRRATCTGPKPCMPPMSWTPSTTGTILQRMPHYDLPLEMLRNHRCAAPAPPDLDDYWQRALARGPGAGRRSGVRAVRGGRLRRARRRRRHLLRRGRRPDQGLVPASARHHRARCPCRVTFIGYGGGRNLPRRARAVRGLRLRRVRDGLARPGRRVDGRAHARSGRRLLRARSTRA